MSLRRTAPSAQLYESSWHTPVVETPRQRWPRQLNDRPSISLARHTDHGGKVFEPGRVYVNNDFTNLFIGFDQAMFYSNNNVFLFIETPAGWSNQFDRIGQRIADNVEGGWPGFSGESFVTNFARLCVFAWGRICRRAVPEFSRPGMDLNLGRASSARCGIYESCRHPAAAIQSVAAALGPYEASYPERNASLLKY